jgi:hypothetical protein
VGNSEAGLSADGTLAAEILLKGFLHIGRHMTHEIHRRQPLKNGALEVQAPAGGVLGARLEWNDVVGLLGHVHGDSR